MKKLLTIVVAAAVLLLSMVVPGEAANTAIFSLPGMDDVRAAAVRWKPDGMRLEEFMAMILAPTWSEVQSGVTTITPSPMTQGRGDVNQALYAFDQDNQTNPYKRAFWASGMGYPQTDIEDAVNTQRAADFVAQTMRGLWDQASGTPAQKRRAAWWPWHACTISLLCEPVFKKILSPDPDANPDATLSLLVTADPNVGRYGGAYWTTCANPATPTAKWDCFAMFIDLAEGNRSWGFNLDGTYKYADGTYSGLGGVSKTGDYNPLSVRMYQWNSYESGVFKENRFWSKNHTTYANSIWAKRLIGSAPQNGLNWSSHSWALCTGSICP